MTELTGLLNNLHASFERESVAFAVGGSFALAALGHPRATADIDLMVLVRGGDLGPVHRALSDPRYSMKNEVTFQDDATGLFLDILPVVDQAQEEAFERARAIPIHGATRIKVLSADGLALMLLREATIGDRTKRRQRLADLDTLARIAKLDEAFLAEWARRMGYTKAFADWKTPP